MRPLRHLKSWLLLLALTVTATAQTPTPPHRIATALGKMPLYFVENQGVYPDEVKYYIQGAYETLFFTNEGVTFALRGKDRGWTVKLDFVRANERVRPEGKDRQEAVISHFTGAEKDWKTGLPTFSMAVYQDLWPGIDLVYRGTVNELKYEFKVAPGADPSKIRLRYRGIEKLEHTDDGALRVSTPEGSFEDAPPVAWQHLNGKRMPVDIAFALGDDGEFGFALGDYDPTRPLVLDPAVLVYCGYLGGIDADVASDIAVDGTGAIYITGGTLSTEATFPVTVGPDLTFGGRGNFDGDAFVAKIDPTGTSLIYCGYIGGAGEDVAVGIAVDAAGNAYVTGGTTSDERTFPVSVGPDLTWNGFADAFVAKVNPSGTRLAYCGYIGGINATFGTSIAIDASGHAYVAGMTKSDQATFPVTVGPDLTFNSTLSGIADTFVAKLSVAGDTLLYCGYIGGDWTEIPYDIAVDAGGDAFLVGYTVSKAGFPVLGGPGLTLKGSDEAWIARVAASGKNLVYCGYINGSGQDGAYGVAVDRQGNAYVFGTTTSDERSFPVLVGPDLTFNGGGHDTFVAKVNPSGALDYCGYIGGTGNEANAPFVNVTVSASAMDIAVDRFGYAYVAGLTQSDERSFPVRGGPGLTYSGQADAFVARVHPSGSTLSYCGYIGGAGVDIATGIAVDGSGNAYTCGWTVSPASSFPVRGGPQQTLRGTADAFVAKIAATEILVSGTPRPGSQVAFTLWSTDDAGLAYQAGMSLGTGPIALGNQRRLDLSPDPLLLTVVAGSLPGVFRDYAGFIDPLGIGLAQFTIPNVRALIGVTVYNAFVTLDPQAVLGFKSVSNSLPLTIIP